MSRVNVWTVYTIAVLASVVEVQAMQTTDTPAALPSCQWCGASEAPASLSWETRISPLDEPGEPLIVEGRVYAADGTTPAPDVLLYVYQTNAAGVYPRLGDETGNARRHGYLRAWMRTDTEGRYRFGTIRPEPYRTRTEPAHIHITVQEPGESEYWIDSYNFDDDPLLTPGVRADLAGLGGSGIMELWRDEDGVWRGERNIVLEPR